MVSVALNPFTNGLGVGAPRADAMRGRNPGQWRVFLYLSAGVRSFEIHAKTGPEAIKSAWDRLKSERTGA